MIVPYICAQCQMIILDPSSAPVVTVVKPFKVQGLKGTMKEKLAMLKFCKKDFTIQNELHQVIKNNEFVTLEM